jgi:hypothetical protein
MVYVEKLASAEGELHALVILLEVEVDFRHDESGKLALWEGFVFI